MNSNAPLATSLTIRPSGDGDVAAIAAIYAHHVLHGTGSFELEAPSVEEMQRRRADVVGKGLPWLVGEIDGRIVGYAYANHFRPRPAYRFTLEDSIYVLPETSGRGVGRLLLAELLARCEALGARQVLAVIGDSANEGSIRLHRALGFVPSGVIRAAGWKFDDWRDVVLMQRPLGQGSSAAAAV